MERDRASGCLLPVRESCGHSRIQKRKKESSCTEIPDPFVFLPQRDMPAWKLLVFL